MTGVHVLYSNPAETFHARKKTQAVKITLHINSDKGATLVGYYYGNGNSTVKLLRQRKKGNINGDQEVAGFTWIHLR
jgi:hypothetical protein